MEPVRVLGLVLVDPPPDPAVLPPGMVDGLLEKMRGDDYWKTVEDYYRSIASEDEQVAERVLRDIKATRKETVIGAFEAMSRFDPHVFTNYQGPALSIIQSQYDVEGALHRIAHMEHIAIDGAGHFIHLAAPDRFLDTLEDFIGDYESAKLDAMV